MDEVLRTRRGCVGKVDTPLVLSPWTTVDVFLWVGRNVLSHRSGRETGDGIEQHAVLIKQCRGWCGVRDCVDGGGAV